MRQLVAVLALAACGGTDRIMLELHGDVGLAKRVEVIVAQPRTFEKLQRSNDPNSTAIGPERTFYIAQRGSTELVFEAPQLIEGVQIQIETGDTEPYLPIVIARDGDGDGDQAQIIGIGVFAPGELFPAIGAGATENPTGQVVYRSDITLYELTVEPAHQIEQQVADGGAILPTPVRKGEVMPVRCDTQTSGLVWRPATAAVEPQLRIMLPLAGSGSSVDRLDRGGDLDCDDHTPKARSDDGDQLDCDDTTPTTFGGAPHETCNGVDDDCDGMLGGFTVTQDCTNGCSTTRVCDDHMPGPGVCVQVCNQCSVPHVRNVAAGSKQACPALSSLTLPFTCNGCAVTLVDVPMGWKILIGDATAPMNGIDEPYMPPTDGVLGILVTPIAPADIYPINVLDGGTFTLVFQPGGMPAVAMSLQLELQMDPTLNCDNGGVTLPMLCR